MEQNFPTMKELSMWFSVTRAKIAKNKTDDLETIDFFLNEAKEACLTYEVLLTARRFVVDDELPLSESLRCACLEWDI